MGSDSTIEKSTLSTPDKKEAMLQALEKCLGNVTQAAKMVGIERTTFYKWCKASSVYKAKVDALKEVSLDFAESALMKRINKGDTTAIIFYLKTQGKQRGYIEKVINENINKDEVLQLER